MAQLKSTLVQGALTVTGNAVASKLIKNGGTSDDILLGDGSTTSKSALMAMINAAVVLKGTAGTGGTVTTTTFPAASESTLGDAYKVITAGTYQGVAAKVGDMLICYHTGSSYAWMLIPSGDDIEDTWREIKVNGTQILANGTTTNPLNLKAGANMTLTNSDGTVTFDATDTGATTVTTTGSGNAFTSAEYNASTRTITFTKGSTFLTSHQSLANYVTLDGAQTITGVKTFSAQPVISTANGLKFDSGNCKLRIYNTSASPTDYAAIEVRSNSTSSNRNLFIDLDNNSLVVGAASGTADTTYKVNVKDTFNATTIYENGTSLATKYAAKGHNHNDVYLGKTTYEWNKEFAAGSNGAVSLGRYNIYDSQLTFDITTTTSFTLSGKLVIASQNGKILKATIYGDASNALAGYLTIYQSAITNNRSWVEIFCNFPGWSKNKVHIYGVALNSATVTNQMTSVTFTNGVPSGVTSGDAKWTGSIVNDITTYDASHSGIGTCTTAAATAAKVVTLPRFALVTNATILVRVSTTNSATSGVTLNVNDTGAKSIYIGGSAWSTSNQLNAGDYLATYDGTYWKLTRIYLTDNNTTYGADRGISLSNGKFGHSNTAVTAVTTAGLYKIKYDAYGHITGTESFTLPTVNNGTLTIQKNGTNVATFTANQSGNATANITVPDPIDYYWANVKVSSSSSTATTPSVQKLGITGSTTATAAAAVTMEYDGSYKALKFVFA
jgi:hypothetical protein